VLDDPTAGFGYDAVLHAVFLGFVFAMVFGHAPIILPAVVRLAVPFRRFFYVPLILLHFALLLRVVGDVLAWNDGRMCGGLLGVLAILLFLVSTAVSVRIGRRTRVSRTLSPGPPQ
jgi:Ca2+/Na+ antiporter